MKELVIKIIEERGHLDGDLLTQAMIELRNTPAPFEVSVATIVNGYELRSLLPVIKRRNVEATKAKEYYDKGSRGLKPFQVEDKVVQHEETTRWDRKDSNNLQNKDKWRHFEEFCHLTCTMN